jgi:hypothetical protein
LVGCGVALVRSGFAFGHEPLMLVNAVLAVDKLRIAIVITAHEASSYGPRRGCRSSLPRDEVFPAGCYLVPGSIGEVEDFDEKTGRRSPSVDKVTGKRVFQVRVGDADPELRTRTREAAPRLRTGRRSW